jgi:hypothetical protein
LARIILSHALLESIRFVMSRKECRDIYGLINRRRFCLRAVPSGPIGRPQVLADIGALACCPQLLAAAVRFSEAPIVTNQFECHPYLKSGG